MPWWIAFRLVSYQKQHINKRNVLPLYYRGRSNYPERGWNPITSFHPFIFLYISHARTRISNAICCGLFCVQRFDVRGGWLISWYCWNCWPVLVKIFARRTKMKSKLMTWIWNNIKWMYKNILMIDCCSTSVNQYFNYILDENELINNNNKSHM